MEYLNKKIDLDLQSEKIIYLNFNSINIQLQAPAFLSIENIHEMQEELTGLETIQDHCLEPNATISYIVDDEINIDYYSAERTLIIQGPKNNFSNGRALVYIAQYVAECMRAIDDNMLLIHAAAIHPPSNNGSYVLLGEKGAGKTTVALRLCHQFGYSLIGNDQIYLGINEKNELITNGGDQWFSVRQTAISNDPYLDAILPNPINLDAPAWNAKAKIIADDMNIAVEDSKTAVKSLYHIRIDHTQEDIYINEWRGLQRALILHERIGRHITGQATPLQDDYGNYLGSLPPIEVAKAMKTRDSLVKLILKYGVTEIFSPDSTSIVNYINQSGQ